MKKILNYSFVFMLLISFQVYYHSTSLYGFNLSAPGIGETSETQLTQDLISNDPIASPEQPVEKITGAKNITISKTVIFEKKLYEILGVKVFNKFWLKTIGKLLGADKCLINMPARYRINLAHALIIMHIYFIFKSIYIINKYYLLPGNLYLIPVIFIILANIIINIYPIILQRYIMILYNSNYKKPIKKSFIRPLQTSM